MGRGEGDKYNAPKSSGQWVSDYAEDFAKSTRTNPYVLVPSWGTEKVEVSTHFNSRRKRVHVLEVEEPRKRAASDGVNLLTACAVPLTD